MPFRKKILYYGLMLLLTLLALEGMARVAYYAAWGQGYGGGRLAGPLNSARPLSPAPTTLPEPVLINHPYYGHTRNLPRHALNAMPPLQRRADRVVIAFLGGSVAEQVSPFLEDALRRRLAASARPLRPIFLELAVGGQRQPQQTLIIANTLLLGGEFDLIINLDGFNEVVGSAGWNPQAGVFPFFPHWWQGQARLTAAEILLAGRIGRLRREQARLAAIGETSPLRRSALFGLVNRWRQERITAEIIQRNHALAAAETAYSLEKHGPRSQWSEEERLSAAAWVWRRSSATLSRLAALAGADYYHFLQPNQYAPDSKSLSPEELARAYKPRGVSGRFAAQGYPLLTRFNRDLQNQGVNYFDLTGIFADHRETLYIDQCCHLNARGYELLAAAMAQRLEPALRRLGQENPPPPAAALAAARRPTPPDALLIAADFQVYMQGDGKGLRYVRPACVPADTAARFFLHLTPRDLADLPPQRREHGFDNRDFSFAEIGGRHWRGQCLAQIPLPDYPLAYLRTGQYAPGDGELWAGGYAFPPPRN